MIELIHGGDIYTRREHCPAVLTDFSANINPLGLPEGVKVAVTAALGDCARYPDPLCRELTQAIALNEGIPAEYILCGGGAADLIYRLAYAAKPKHALVLAPAFEEYEQALTAAGCAVQHHLLYEQEDFLLTPRILEELTDDLDLLFLCSPNNPTGQPVDRALLCQILQRCEEKNILLCVDECFCGFLDDPDAYTMKDQLCGHNNLFLLKAFTKLYAMAGLRLGYALCANRALLEQMYACGAPWSVSHPAQVAGLQALREHAYLRQGKALVAQERERLKNGLARLGCKVYGSHANYVFFRPHIPNLCEHMLSYGFLLRDCRNYKGLQGEFCRIAVRCSADNKALLNAMEDAALCQ